MLTIIELVENASPNSRGYTILDADKLFAEAKIEDHLDQLDYIFSLMVGGCETSGIVDAVEEVYLSITLDKLSEHGVCLADDATLFQAITYLRVFLSITAFEDLASVVEYVDETELTPEERLLEITTFVTDVQSDALLGSIASVSEVCMTMIRDYCNVELDKRKYRPVEVFDNKHIKAFIALTKTDGFTKYTPSRFIRFIREEGGKLGYDVGVYLREFFDDGITQVTDDVVGDVIAAHLGMGIPPESIIDVVSRTIEPFVHDASVLSGLIQKLSSFEFMKASKGVV
jgi:hypothetical protein